MKIKFLIFILIVFQLNPILLGQDNSVESDCPSTEVGIILGTSDDIINSEERAHPEIEIPFWTNYDFTKKDEYSILIFNADTNEDDLYLIKDLETLRAIQEKYNHPTTVFNNHCESETYSTIILVKDKQIIEFAKFYWDCNILETKCGPINFDSFIFSNNHKKISKEDGEEVFTTKDELDKFIERVLADENVLLFKQTEDFLAKVQFVFQGGVDEMNNFLKDEFYLKLTKEKLEDQKNNFSNKRKSFIELDEEGQLIEVLVRNKVWNFVIELEEWTISEENPQDYIITVSYSNEDLNLELENVIKHWVVSKYKLDFLKIKN